MSKLYDAAVALADEMTPVFPCFADKSPAVDGGFHAADINPQPGDYGPGRLVAMPTGTESGYDVLDIDPRHGGDDWLNKVRADLPTTRTQRTQSGGLHLYFKAHAALRCSMSKIAQGVDVRADGGYVIRWDCSGLPVEHPDTVADWPEWLLNAAQGHRIRHRDNPSRSLADLAAPSISAVVDLLNRMPNPDHATRDDYLRVMMAAKGCINGLGGDGDDDEIAEAAIEWADRWCGSPGYDAEREKWETDFSTRDAPLAGWQNLLAAAARLGVDVSAERGAQADAEFGALALPATGIETVPTCEIMGNPDWRSKLLFNDKGDPKPWLANSSLAFREAPAWAGLVVWNDFKQQAVFAAPPPWHVGAFTPRPVDDVDFSRAAEWLQVEEIGVSSGIAAESMIVAAHERKFHPVRDYLFRVQHPNRAGIDTWLIDFLGAEDTPLNRAFGAKFLMSAVARILKPGCQVDTVLVLEGEQGIRKSTALRVLAGEDAFTDHLPDLANKDAMAQLQGMWIIEHAEFDMLGKADAARAKEFISRRVDRFRPSYGRVAKDFPRQCVFAATINPGGDGYLKDPTGARRFWPVRCGVGWPVGRQVDAAALAAVRDSLWGEAMHRVASGEPWWLHNTSLETAQKTVADMRFDGDVWADRVAAICGKRPHVTAAFVLDKLGMKPHEQNKQAQRRVTDTLKFIKWWKSYNSKARTNLWYPPADWTPPDAPDDADVPLGELM